MSWNIGRAQVRLRREAPHRVVSVGQRPKSRGWKSVYRALRDEGRSSSALPARSQLNMDTAFCLQQFVNSC